MRLKNTVPLLRHVDLSLLQGSDLPFMYNGVRWLMAR
jgi:hypothetical protein